MKSAKYRDQPDTTDNGVNLRRWRYRAIAPGNQRIASQHGYNWPGFWGEFAHPHVVDHALTQRTDGVCGRNHDTAPILKQGGLPHFIDIGNSNMLSITIRLCYDSLARSGLVLWPNSASQCQIQLRLIFEVVRSSAEFYNLFLVIT